ncbi:MAG: type II toxin-antitoxin system RelE/ParE family toxin [Candidatus Marinimicrobia bacterium]|nr:type II toxin-antitoxin system RelE/ParE family toxin [Candidatus Neomarinimicrobiota bacterium]
MILSFKHKGLQKFYETGSKAGIQAKQEKRMRLMLSALDTATRIDDMDIPSFKLHPLTGSRKEIWSISVSGNWRLTFKFEDGNAHIVNYEDYH